MKDDFRAKRLALRLLAGLMLIVLACKAPGSVRQSPLDVTDEETRVAEIEKTPPEDRTVEDVEEYDRSKLIIELNNLEKMRSRIASGEYKSDPKLTKSENLQRSLSRERTPVPRSLDDRIDQIRRELGPPYIDHSGFTIELEEAVSAVYTGTPQGIYVGPVTPRQFSMAFEFIELHDICGSGRGRISMTLWNVGEQGGTEFGQVECAEYYPPMFTSTRGSHGETCTEVVDYAKNMADFCVFLTFTGGGNGKIINQVNNGEVIGHFIGGTTLKIFNEEIPVPDPSVFEGMQ